jgi:hypothetical protein
MAGRRDDAALLAYYRAVLRSLCRSAGESGPTFLPTRAEDFLHSFLAFSGGRVVSDEAAASGIETGRPQSSFRRIQVESAFGRHLVFVTDGHLPHPYGRETTGYEVIDLTATLHKAGSLGVKLLVAPVTVQSRISAMVQFRGGYIGEIHSISQ